MDVLDLAAGECRTSGTWRWELTDSGGATIADRSVVVDRGAFAFAGFIDLYRFIRRNADPDNRQASEAELVRIVGEWIGRELLGSVGEEIVSRAPAVVRVHLPEEADWLMFRPWEIAVVDGEPLARQDVSFVFEGRDRPQGAKAPVGDRLRMLAVFSLPSGGSMLALRRERHELARLVRQLRARRGLAIELSVLQYGVTREKLKEAALSGDGWDVLHISGHGLADALALELPDGSADEVNTTDLVRLLRPARSRLKLVVLSSCQSAAATAAETLRWLRADEQAVQLDQVADEEAGSVAGDGVPGLGRTVMNALDTAVLAMRYPVVDDFATRFSDELYEMLFAHGRGLDSAVQLALPAAAGDSPTPGVPAISIGTPTLFGVRAIGLSLVPPRSDAVLSESTAMAGFPKEPERFVGRAESMARATAALAPDSGRTGVLFHGMAGAGKTTCALELAYRHEESFAGGLAYWSAPKDADQALQALPDFVQQLENQLTGVQLVHAIGSVAELQKELPRFVETLERTGRLIVVDNIETLLTPEAKWRDQRWQLLFDALTGHGGESRAVFTSRLIPAALDRDAVLVRQVHALSLAESALLARELPHLGGLLVESAEGADLVRRTLAVVQGHPKLLGLADAAAAEPAVLRSRLDAAEPGADEAVAQLRTFFQTGETALESDRFLETLSVWTALAAERLSEPARLLLQVLCVIEEDDRNSIVLGETWPAIWRDLDDTSDVPDIDPAVDELIAAALIETERREAHVGSSETPVEVIQAISLYAVHPGIAETIRERADEKLRTIVDTALARFWANVYSESVAQEQAEGLGELLSTAGESAARYLMRLSEYELAAALLDEALVRATSPARLAAIEPLVRRLVEVSDVGAVQALHARVLRSSDPEQAEAQLTGNLESAIEAKDFWRAASLIPSLAMILMTQGRLREALALVARVQELEESGGADSWSSVSTECTRQQVLAAMGEYETVLQETDALRVRMTELEDKALEKEWIVPWSVRETVLDTAHTAALRLGRSELALELSREAMVSKRGRGASRHELAVRAIGDYGPLIALGRFGECEELLDWCHSEFVRSRDTRALALVFSARASLAAQRGDPAAAVDLEMTALRYEYIAGDPERVAQTHENIAAWQRAARSDGAAAFAHTVAAALIYRLADMKGHEESADSRVGVVLLTHDFEPMAFDELMTTMDAMRGARFGELVTALCPDPERREQAMAATFASAGEHRDRLQAWIDPVVTTVATAAGGDDDALTSFREFREELAGAEVYREFLAAADAVIDGERRRELLRVDHPVLTVAMDQILARIN